MRNTQWKHKIGGRKTPVILTLFMFAIFGGLTGWLYSANNGAFLFTGLFSAILLALVIATAYRLAFFKVLIGKDGFYYQTGPGSGGYYDYTQVEKAWAHSGEAQNRAQEDYCNIEIPGLPVIRFRFFYDDEKAVSYLIRRIEAAAKTNAAEKEKYLIDGKVFGKTRFVLGIVFLIVIAFIDTVIVKTSGLAFMVIPGVIMAIYVLVLLINSNLFFRVKIEEKGFYCQTNPFNGQYYEYSEIIYCERIKKVIRIRRARRAENPRYYFFFEFTDAGGVTRKFQFEDQIHGHEVNILKERIDNAINAGSEDK